MTGNASDFILYPETFHLGVGERIAQRVEAFNGALTTTGQGGAPRVAGLQLTARGIMGNEEQHTLYKRIPGLIQERDPFSNAPVADSKLEHLEHVGIKLNRRIGPIKGTYDQFRKIGQSSQVFSMEIGRQTGDAIFQDYLNTAITAAIAALRNTTVAGSNIYDARKAAGETLDYAHLIGGKRTFGDHMETALLIMDSGAYYDLVSNDAGNKLFGVSDITIREGTPATGGSPVLVTDSPSLTATAGEQHILGLVPGGVTVTESEERLVKSEDVFLEENLGMRIQGENAYNLDIMGFKWDSAAGGINPNAAAAGLPTNWDMYASSHKHIHGYLIEAAAA